MSFDVDAIRRDFPILARDDRRASPRVSGLGGHESTSRSQVIDAELDFYRHHNANAHRGIYTLAEEATELFEGARATHRPVPRRALALDDRVHTRHHGVDQPRRARLGPEVPRAGRRGAAHRDGAPLQHRALAVHRGGHRRRAAVHPADRRRAARSLRPWVAAHRTHEDPRGDRHVERARHVPAAARADRRGPRRRRDRAGRRRAVRAPSRGRRGRARAATSSRSAGHKMLGPTASGGLYGKRRAARRDGPVPRGRRDDPRGLPRPLDVQGRRRTSSRPARCRLAQQVGLGAAVRLPRGRRDGRDPRATRRRSRPTRSTDCSKPGPRIFGPKDVAVRGGEISLLVPRRASRTTSRRSCPRRGSRSVRVTTARSS